jgi:IS30 family transposase
MLHPLPGFATYPTRHCVTGSLKHVYDYHGFPVSEDLLTWDQGKEMALHAEVTAALGMPVYFCDKASPWQRPSNENTNGLLRQYFPKGSDLRAHGPDDLAAVAAELNARPRKSLGWDAPAALLGL